MGTETKKLGEMLVEAGIINPAQLQEALRHQRIAGGRMGSNLVALGFVSEEVLMDFLAHQTGVPRLDTRNLDVPAAVLKRIPKRLAEQLNVLPIEHKEPRSLVLAMVDPSDLNAIDSARFASGLHIEPVVVSHSALRQAIAEQYRKIETPGGVIEVDTNPGAGGLPVTIDAHLAEPMLIHHVQPGKYSRDPFMDEAPETANLPAASNPFSFFTADPLEPQDPDASAIAAFGADAPMVIHARPGANLQARRLETFQTRTLVLGVIKMLQRRGILGDDELQRFIANLIDAGELKDEERPG